MHIVRKHIRNVTIVLVLTGILVSLLFHNFFKNPFYYFAADNSELYFPFWVFVNKALRTGQFPLLNNYWFAGSLPFAALETSVFYPPYLFFQLLHNAQNYVNVSYLYFFGFEILHYFIASIGFYFLLKSGLKLNSIASICGAVIYATTGSFIGRFVHIIVIFTMAWLPYLYFFYLKFIERFRTRYAVGVIVSLFFIITSSHPQYTYYVFIFFTILILYSLFASPANQRIKIGIYSFTLVLIACLLAAPKLLLTAELSQNIVHSSLETSVYNLYNSLHPLYFLTLFVPYLFGKHQVGYWGSQYPWGNWENYIYIGIIPFFFVFFSLGWKNKKWLFLIILQLMISLLFLFGEYNPVSTLLNQYLPFSQSITMISKMTFLFHFFICMLVAIGIQKFLENFRSNKIISVTLSVSILFIGILLLILDNATLILPASRAIPSLAAQEFARQNILLAFVLLGASLCIIWISLLIKKKKILLFLIPLFILDIFLNGGFFNPIEGSPASPSSYFGTNSFTEIVKRDRGIYRVNDLAPRNTNMVNGIESTYGYHTVETNAYHTIIPYIGNPNVLDLMNVKYISTNIPPNTKFKEIAPNIWLNSTYMPRISIIPSYLLANDKNEILLTVTSPRFNPRLQVALINNKSVTNTLNIFNIPINKNSAVHSLNEKLTIENISSTKLTATVTTNQDSLLLFSQFNYPGWRATVDGKESALLMANAFEYALPIHAGSHVVEFVFDSYPFKLGVAIQIITLFFLFALMVFFHILKNKNRGMVIHGK